MAMQDKISFTELEEKMYKAICEIGQRNMRYVLEEYDAFLQRNRDKKRYRCKGKKKTTIKTIFGEVIYRRNVYIDYDSVKHHGRKHVYLLDEEMKINKVGAFSLNVVEEMYNGISEMSYRKCAETISRNTGQGVSAMGVWNIIQKLGNKLGLEEDKILQEFKNGMCNGGKEVPVLFEEIDGVYISLQGKDRKQRNNNGEIKVSLAYSGWENIGTNRFMLKDKVITAGFETPRVFHEKREAAIAQKYNIDEVKIRILNSDGATWIKDIVNENTYYQLDPFHKYKAITKNIPHKTAAKEIRKLLDNGEIDKMFDYMDTYKNSLSDDKQIEKVKKLESYFRNNQDGLIPYTKRDIHVPAAAKGIEYRTLGTMENHIWSVVAKRMKHNHTSWSVKGGNNLAKILAKKCSGENVISGLFDDEYQFDKDILRKIEAFSAAKIPKHVGKGYDYPVKGHLMYTDMPIINDGRLFFEISR